MSKETNNEELFILPKSPLKSDVNRHARDNEDNITTMLRCKHSSTMDDLMEQLANNFNLLISREKKGRKCKTTHKEEIMTNDIVLIVLSDKGIEDATSCNEEEEDEMTIMTKRDIQEFKDT